jgi:hypothetical protein
MFCSIECRKKLYSLYGENIGMTLLTDDEIGNLKYLRLKLLKDAEHAVNGNREVINEFRRDSNRETIFDFSFCEMNDKEVKKAQLKCFFGLMCRKMFAKSKSIDDYLLGIAQANSLTLQIISSSGANGLDAFTICLFGSLFNHNCDPNVHRFSVDNKIFFYVTKPVKPGEQLFICYK